MAVMDASVLVAVLTGGECSSWAERQLSARSKRHSLWAPHLIDAEVGHSLRRLASIGRLEDDRAAAALRDLTGFPLRRIVHAGLLDRAWALRHNFSFYDGLYVALAQQLDTPLVTLDVRLAKAAATATSIEVLTIS
ncbi:MAG TPA: type II toxin-antitoxin system VapC family toxin [Solirubrobacterales bacterium]